MGKTVVKYRRDRDYVEDDKPRGKKSDQIGKYQRKLSYEDVLEQYEDEMSLEFQDEDDML